MVPMSSSSSKPDTYYMRFTFMPMDIPEVNKDEAKQVLKVNLTWLVNKKHEKDVAHREDSTSLDEKPTYPRASP